MDIVTVAGMALGLLGAISSVWFVTDKLMSRRRLKWRFTEKAVSQMVAEMHANGFSPTLIVGIGRGGAIVGAMISGVLGHRPLIVIDRKYVWDEGRRTEDLVERLTISVGLEHVLLVAGEVHSGNTMRLYYDYFKNTLHAHEVRRAALLVEKGSTEPIEYCGLSTTNKALRMPWMFAKSYRRDSRSEEEARGLGMNRGIMDN